MESYGGNTFSNMIEQAEDFLKRHSTLVFNGSPEEAHDMLVLTSDMVKKVLHEDFQHDLKVSALQILDKGLNKIDPYSVILCVNRNSESGVSTLQIIDELISLIDGHGHLLIDCEEVAQRVKIIRDPEFLDQLKMSSSLNNIKFVLDEMKDLLLRAKGNSPKSINSIDTFRSDTSLVRIDSENRLNIVRYDYFTIQEIQKSKLYHETHSTVLCNKSLEARDAGTMKYCFDLADEYIKFHQNVSQSYPDGAYIKKTLRFIITYMYYIRTYLYNSKCDKTKIKSKIANNIQEFACILYNFPLLTILRAENKNWIVEYLNDVTYVVHPIYFRETQAYFPSMVRDPLNSIWLAIRQLYNICLKNFKPWLLMKSSIETQLLIQPQGLSRSESGGQPAGHNSISKVSSISLETVVLERFFEVWKNKFEKLKYVNDVLAKCPDDKCCICLEKFADIIGNTSKSADLAVLPTCYHLFCSKCLQNDIFLSGKK